MGTDVAARYRTQQLGELRALESRIADLDPQIAPLAAEQARIDELRDETALCWST